MRKWLLLLAIFVPLLAKGACPTDTSYLTTSGQLTTLAALGITNCFYVAATITSGGVTPSDTNSGTDELHPWIHAPAMAGATGVPGSHVIAPGEGYIFKGGDTWHFGDSSLSPFVTGTWDFNHNGQGGPNGTATNPIYIGVDKSWFSGSSWVRPIFNADNPTELALTGCSTNSSGTSCLNKSVASCLHSIGTVAGTGNAFISFSNRKYFIFDNFEMTGLCSSVVKANGFDRYVAYGSETGPLGYYNLYIHGWTHVPFFFINSPTDCCKNPNTGLPEDCGAQPPNPTPVPVYCESTETFGGDAGNGSAPAGSDGDTIQYVVVDGFDSDPRGAWIGFSGFFNVHHCAFRYISSEITKFSHVFHDNLEEFWYDNGHSNLMEESGNSGRPQAAFYNNVVRFISPPDWPVSLVGWWLLPSVGQTYYAFNNLWYQIGNIQYWNVGGNGSGNTGGTYNYFNNTLQNGVGASVYIYGNGNIQPGATFNSTNDHLITDTSSPFQNAGKVTATTEKIQTNSQATSAGYTTTQTPFVYAPTSSSSPTVGTGTNMQAQCTAMLNSSSPYIQAAGTACKSDTSYGPAYNSTTHTVTGVVRATVPRPTSGNWNIGAYQFSGPAPPVSTVTWTNVHQTIDGFGASDYTAGIAGVPILRFNSTQAAQLFSPSSGVGLSLLRVGVPSDGSCNTVNNTCAGAYADAQLAITQGAKVWATAFGPPASMKTNGSVDCTGGGGNGALSAGSYAAYATYLSNYLKSMTALGIPIYALSVANEPNFCSTAYPGALWTNTQFDTFIKTNLNPTLTANGQGSVKIMMPETSGNSQMSGKANTCVADTSCIPDILAWHDYDATYNPPNSVLNPFPGFSGSYWETEVSAGVGYGPSLCGGCWDPSIADGLLWAQIIHNRMAVASANAWHFWEGVQFSSETNINSGLIYADGVTTSKRMFVMGNWAKFWRPGWKRIDTSVNPQPGVFVSAAKDPVGGGFAIVAVNTNTGAGGVQQTFNLSAFPTVTSLTSYVTSATQNLANVAAPPASNTFTATLTPQSVTTFVGTTSTTSPAVTWSPTSFAFGSVTVNSSSTTFLTLQNTGTASLNVSLSTSGASVFTIVSGGTCVNGGVIAAGGSCTVKAQFAPTSAISYSGSITENDSAHGVSGIVSLSGTGAAVASPAVTWTPSSFNFGNVGVGNTPTNVFTLKNTGNATLNVSLSMAGSGAFTNSSTTCGATLTASSTCTVTVQFAPTTTTSYSGSLVETDATNSVTGSVALSGSGVGTPVISLSPSSFNFGNVTVGQTSSQPFTLKNTGTAVLNITSVSVSGTGFSIANGCGTTLAINATCTITATFSPSAATSYSGTLTVADTTDGISSGIAAISGTGTAISQPVATWSPSTFNFGNVATGTTPTQIIVLINTGNANLNLTAIVASGTGFSQVNSCSSPLAAGSQCNVTVTFSPVAVTSYSGTLTVTDTPNNVSSVVPLSGAGIAPALPIVTWTPASVDFGGVPVNGTATQIFTLTNTGSAPLNVSLSMTGSPILTFSELDNCGAILAVNAQCQVTVQFVPTEALKYTGFLIETDSANNVSGSAALSGTGIAALGKNKKLTL